jgi:hypothetical protein
MALALNVFQTVTKVLQISQQEVYIAPIGYTGVFLLAQVTNVGDVSEDITVLHRRIVSGSPLDTELMKNYPVSGKDTLNLFSGKLILESGDRLVISSSNNAGIGSGTNLKFVGSILETLN